MLIRRAKKLASAQDRLETLSATELEEVSGGHGGGHGHGHHGHGHHSRHHHRRHRHHRPH